MERCLNIKQLLQIHNQGERGILSFSGGIHPTFINAMIHKDGSKKMLESRPEDALLKLVLTVETVETERRILKYLTLSFCEIFRL